MKRRTRPVERGYEDTSMRTVAPGLASAAADAAVSALERATSEPPRLGEHPDKVFCTGGDDATTEALERIQAQGSETGMGCDVSTAQATPSVERPHAFPIRKFHSLLFLCLEFPARERIESDKLQSCKTGTNIYKCKDDWPSHCL